MPDKITELTQRLGAVLEDLREAGGKDPETMWLIGSLTCDIIDKVKARTWSEFKETASDATYNQVLTDFQDVGNRLYQSGEPKRAYAMQALGISLVCSRQREYQVVVEGEKLLDAVIEGAVKLYRKTQRTN